MKTISERATELRDASLHKDRYERDHYDCIAQAINEWQQSVEERLATPKVVETVGNMAAVVKAKAQ